MRGKSAILDGPDGAFVVAEADVPDPDPNGCWCGRSCAGSAEPTPTSIAAGYPASPSPLCSAMRRSVSSSSLARTSTRTAPGGPLATGDRVYIQPGMSCRQCLYCVVHQQPTLCLKRRGYGFRPLKDAPPDFQGGFSQYLNLVPGSTYLKMNTNAETAVVLEPLTIGLHQVSRVSMPVGSTAVIQGLGPSAFSRWSPRARRAPCARLWSARQTSSGAGEDLRRGSHHQHRRRARSAERVRMVREETPGGYGADVVFECTGVPASPQKDSTCCAEAAPTSKRDTTPITATWRSTRSVTWSTSRSPWSPCGARTPPLRGRPGADRVGQVPVRRSRLSPAAPRPGRGGVAAIGGTYRLDGEEIRKVAVAAHDA